ncbi:MAG: 2-C-methyl-D-erythritol 2,4-cyclodiphosphate synthase [Synergistaceae bacterium]|jgi:2-C-methyl-D-erythritol 4-phosphate cytidylyltransferase/2-C-methyl-D-erythritol 2,4-cyclodiphosphate synthase|nr:2-C-methyl-D-erythritol 2,4-cyclodiphosphate synthase [Synergistaceae bacterium]
MSASNGTWSFILVAAGAGTRMGGVPKQFRMLGGRPMWAWSAGVAAELSARGRIDELIVVIPSGWEETFGSFRPDCPMSVTIGGSTRSESVRNGLAMASSDFVLIHDAARPFLDTDMCEALMDSTTELRGAVPLLSSVDSLKMIEGDVIRSIPRDIIRRTQTPQAFPRESIAKVLEASPGGSTDEASLWLEMSGDLARVDGSEKNFKVTTEFDWLVATSLVNGSREIRVGIGYDVHELTPGRRLVLGGVEIPSELGLLGHSDADIICHAVSDALLGAAGEGDIGTLFPASDESYRNADSTALLTEVLGLITKERWRVSWIDVVLIAQVPKLAGYIPAIIGNLQKLFTDSAFYVKLSVKVKSGEFVGSVGRAECMACHAVATLERFTL